MSDFIHLHNHTHYSLLDGACRINDLLEACHDFKMPALAITDHGNMFGVIDFYLQAKKAGIKPIIGSEVYMAPKHRTIKTSTKGGSTAAYHLILLAKNITGYKNLMKLVSIGYLEGFYYKPRIDFEVLEQYSEGLIALSACLKGAIPNKILHNAYDSATKIALRFKEIFGDDFYLELQDHKLKEEEIAREGLLKLSKELGIKVAATNDTHYLKREHYEAHDVLLCLQTGKDYDDPKRMRYNTDQIYFKSPAEMKALFSYIPAAIENTLEISEKCNLELDLSQNYLPEFKIPENEGEIDIKEYLIKAARSGLPGRYDAVTDDLQNRLDYELDIINKMGYAGYFLITKDFIDFARENGIPVGPGRGSAAGSLVSYALGITNVDPIKYDLIFERFLNPERVTLPDIDIDFCYERREEIIDYVRQKYGENNVTQIITFGTMAARAVIRDVGRVLKMPYGDVDKIAKMIPAVLKMTLPKALELVPELKEIAQSDDIHRKLIEYSLTLEGLARHASTHAAGVVITPGELTNYTPLYKSNTNDITTQFEMTILEEVGVLKMDFLGLRTLTVISNTLKALEKRGIKIDLDNLSLDDEETFNIFANGQTIGIFQFESSGMREYLRKLKPKAITDLIAMNALYRPGPMDMIDDFIARSHGEKEIEYMHPLLEPILEETYGIIVYQEQVMRIASELGGFSLGGADLLRRAMGKKKVELMKEQRKKFIKGAAEKDVTEKVANDIFDLMDKFAGYGFNKSHAACYSIVAYQTAYLKAHYPAEFMAANLTSEMSDTKRVVTLIDECRRMGISVLPPDVNESYADFVATEKGIRFGMGAIKNVGINPIKSVVKGRETTGRFNSIFELVSNIDLRNVNKKVLESLILAGAMDSLEGHRVQKLEAIELAIGYAQSVNADRAMGQTRLFDAGSEQVVDDVPVLPVAQPWTESEELTHEKEMLGFYISGHPLQKYEDELHAFSTISLDSLKNTIEGQVVRIVGLINEITKKLDRRGNAIAFVSFEDFSESTELLIFSDAYAKFHEALQKDAIVAIIGRISYRDQEEPKIMVDEVYAIDEVRERFTRDVTLNLDINEIPESAIQNIVAILEKNKGNCPLYLRVKKQHETFLVRSRKYRINPGTRLIKRLTALLGKENIEVKARNNLSHKNGNGFGNRNNMSGRKHNSKNGNNVHKAFR
ncbi:DNA polymerase III subunit alpha [candidate division KSB1 bacterium]|nr:DNA polymerase III subunit alpha [candidate division KSB1 bacterium]